MLEGIVRILHALMDSGVAGQSGSAAPESMQEQRALQGRKGSRITVVNGNLFLTRVNLLTLQWCAEAFRIFSGFYSTCSKNIKNRGPAHPPVMGVSPGAQLLAWFAKFQMTMRTAIVAAFLLMYIFQLPHNFLTYFWSESSDLRIFAGSSRSALGQESISRLPRIYSGIF